MTMGLWFPLALTGFLLLASGTILHTVGMATPNWTVRHFSEMGPYTSCDVISCDQTSSENDYVRAVKGLTMTGMALGVFAVIVSVLGMVFPEEKIFPIVTAGLALVSFIIILTGVCVWAADVHDDSADFGYSFAISLVGGIIILLGGIFVVIGGRVEKS